MINEKIIIFQGFVFLILLLIASITDLKRREIDNFICVGILIVALIHNGSFLGVFTTSLPFFIFALIDENGVGGGDIKLLGACGGVLGVVGGMYQIVISLSLVVLYSLLILILKGKKEYKNLRVPLAPFLCVGGTLSFIFEKVIY